MFQAQVVASMTWARARFVPTQRLRKSGAWPYIESPILCHVAKATRDRRVHGVFFATLELLRRKRNISSTSSKNLQEYKMVMIAQNHT